MAATTRVLVLGAGAVGGLIAARLAENPALTVLAAVRSERAPLTLTVDGIERSPAVELVTEPADARPVDWVVIATKTYDVAGLEPWLACPHTARSRVAVAQNGVEHAERLSDWVAAERVVPLVVTYGVERPGPGRVLQTLDGVVRAPATAFGAELAALAAPTGLTVELVEDHRAAVWTKLCWNVVGNSITTLADVAVREIGRRPDLRTLGRELAEECVAVARAEGVRAAEDIADEILGAVQRLPPSVRSSMWQDRHAGRPFEHEALSGAVLRAAARHGMPVPRTTVVHQWLSALSPGRRPSVPVVQLPRVRCVRPEGFGEPV